MKGGGDRFYSELGVNYLPANLLGQSSADRGWFSSRVVRPDLVLVWSGEVTGSERCWENDCVLSLHDDHDTFPHSLLSFITLIYATYYPSLFFFYTHLRSPCDSLSLLLFPVSGNT